LLRSLGALDGTKWSLVAIAKKLAVNLQAMWIGGPFFSSETRDGIMI
jgi:hypothetical protein